MNPETQDPDVVREVAVIDSLAIADRLLALGGFLESVGLERFGFAILALALAVDQ